MTALDDSRFRDGRSANSVVSFSKRRRAFLLLLGGEVPSRGSAWGEGGLFSPWGSWRGRAFQLTFPRNE